MEFEEVEVLAKTILKKMAGMSMRGFTVEEAVFFSSKLRWYKGKLGPVVAFDEADLKYLRAILDRRINEGN